MPISVAEQIQITTGGVRPPNASIVQMIRVISSNHSLAFRTGLKTFATTDVNDEPINTLASSYMSKMTSITSQVFNDQKELFLRLLYIIVSIIAKEVGNISTVENANDSLWETFLNTHTLTAMEVLAGVTLAEKAEYDSI